MSNWAIVIGINEYWEPDKSLYGAVNDALEMTRWLMDENGGNVAPENLYLLTRPVNPTVYRDGTKLPIGIVKSDAESDNLDDAILDIKVRGGDGEKFFFYFSGHGLTSDFSDEPAIAMANFQQGREKNALTLKSIGECFKAKRFDEQFFFIDACRNVLPWNWLFNVGEISCGGKSSPDFAPTQYWLNATAPRLKSVETASSSGEGGAFTGILLKGLNGLSAAKVFVKGDFEFPYQVFFSQLARYVETEVLKKQFVVSEKGQPEQFQRPLWDAKNSTQAHSGVLRKFRPGDPQISPVQLDIFVAPQNAWNDATIIVTGDDANIIIVKPVGDAPVALNQQTMPMSYSIRATANGYAPAQPYWSCNVYEDAKIDVRLEAATSMVNTSPPLNLPTGMFGDRESVEKAYNSALSRGYIKDDVNVIMSDQTRDSYFADSDDSDLGSKAMEGAGLGAAIGGTTGAVFAAIATTDNSITLPGLGLIVVGPLAAALVGAVGGSLTGGLVGALVGLGIPKERAKHYEEGIKNGGVVMGINPRSNEDADYFENEWRRNSETIKNSGEMTVPDKSLTYKTATLTVESTDVLAPLEIRDSVGRLIAAGNGRLTAAQLPTGFYHARLVTPEGRYTEKLVDFSLPAGSDAGELPAIELNQSVVLDAPAPSVSPIFDEMIKKMNFKVDTQNNLHVSKYVGAVATPQLTTILAITGSVVTESHGLEGNAENFGLPAFAQSASGASAGIRIIVAEETVNLNKADSYLSQIKINLRSQDIVDSTTKDVGFQSSTKIKGLAQYVQAAMPGAYFLSLSLPDSEVPTNFSLAVLPDRVTLLILHRRPNNSIRVSGFAPSSLPEQDFQLLEVKMRNLRQLDLLQRYYLSDRLNSDQTLEEAEDLLKDANELLNAKWIDPLAGCLGGYTLLQLDKANKLEKAAANMVKYYNELSDSHILQAEFLKAQKPPTKKKIVDAYLEALDRGIPIFAEGLRRLATAIDKYKMEHPLAPHVLEIYQNRVRNSLWTIWTESKQNKNQRG